MNTLSSGPSRETKLNIVLKELDGQIEAVRSRMETLSGRLEKLMMPATPEVATDCQKPETFPSALQEIRTLEAKVKTVKYHLDEILTRLEV